MQKISILGSTENSIFREGNSPLGWIWEIVSVLTVF